MPERQLSNGVCLHWREAGDPAKPPVVWIHGGSVEDSSFMVPDLEPFFGRVRALFPDTRGHGRSSTFERVEDYGYPQKAEDVLLWLDALGIERAVWGGASMGGALSLWAAIHAPARVRAVISISGPPYEPPAEDKAWWRDASPADRDRAGGRLLRRQRPAAHGRGGAGALQGAAGALRRDDRAAAPSFHRVPAGAARRDLLARATGSRTARASAAPCSSSPAARITFRRSPCPSGWPRPSPAHAWPVIEGGGHFPNRTHRAEVQSADRRVPRRDRRLAADRE